MHLGRFASEVEDGDVVQVGSMLCWTPVQLCSVVRFSNIHFNIILHYHISKKLTSEAPCLHNLTVYNRVHWALCKHHKDTALHLPLS
jgi:hypothetical protein